MSEHESFHAAALAQSLAKTQGFALCGIASADASAYAEQLTRWLAEGKNGEMHYLAEHAEVRSDPGKLVEGAASVIVVADAYAVQGARGQVAKGSSANQQCSTAQHSAPAPLDPLAPPRGSVAKYAWGDDYHKVLKKRLHTICNTLEEQYPGHLYRATTDTAPIFERELASRAGLGWTGKHTLLIHPRYGSYFLLGTIVTTLNMQTSELAGFPAPLAPPTDHCGNCTRCIDACPTDAITPYSIDARRCISYLTLEHRSLIDEQFHEPMGQWVAGCDICQDVCPHNQRRTSLAAQDNDPLQVHARYAPHDYAAGFGLLEVLNWSAEDRQAAFVGSALKRVKLDMMQRNALIAAGNVLKQHGHTALREKVIELASADNVAPLVQQTARQICHRLGLLA